MIDQTQAPAFSDQDLERALQLLSEPGRLDQAQVLVSQAAPGLLEILDRVLQSKDWFGSAHQAEILKAAGTADPDERLTAVSNLIRNETQIGMLIGVAIGFELSQLLGQREQLDPESV